MKFMKYRHLVLVAYGLLATNFVASQTLTAPAPLVATAGTERSVSEWLMRLHEASRNRAYIGTFVVSSSTGNLSSARIWHVCDGSQQMERVESLTGAPRSTFRRNEQVVTFLPETKVARTEKRDAYGLFPGLINAADSSIPEFYSARQIGQERVAGFDADVVQLSPKDKLRYGYRIWSEKRTGLVVKLQTVDGDGKVLEQAAFSELQLDAPVKMDKLAQMMANTSGWKLEKSELVKTTAAAEGWSLRTPVAGFKPVGCYRRPAAPVGGTVPEPTMQWIFSDGLASVSLFVEPYDSQRHTQEGLMALGATQTLVRRLGSKAGDGGEQPSAWWLTAVGEVPPQTLQAFARSLERRK
jgi:sigma-E factor negative regulatory protein RseB